MVQFKSDVDVELVQHVGSDTTIAEAAWVSNYGGNIPTDRRERVPGLINFLMRDRHGCYDDETEVLTSEGWKYWTDVTGLESFATLDLNTDAITYQRATHRVRKTVTGEMIRISSPQVDYLVTPDHNMVAAARTTGGWREYSLVPAHQFKERSYRLRLAGGTWSGPIHNPELAELAGFIAADGSFTGTSIEFHLHREDKIAWLKARFPEVVEKACGHFRLTGAPEDLRLLAKSTYTGEGKRCLPPALLAQGDPETLQALLEGYLQGDGSIKPTGTRTCSTTSRQMVDDLQELGMKIGQPVQEIRPLTERSSAFGVSTLYRLSMPTRSRSPRVGWTTSDRTTQVQSVPYSGEVHCVTVPNGTLYVRRNGKVSWCGNSPFEHNALTFRVSAPLFVFYEWHRHRVGWSYNEESARYRELEPVFYVPGPDRALRQEGRPGAYTFTAGDYQQQAIVDGTHRRAAREAWGEYQYLLDRGIAREVARNVLPVSVYKTQYATTNLRALFAFLSLRWAHPLSELSTFPLREIEMVAEKLEAEARPLFPEAFKAFDKQGRVAP